MKLHLFLSMDVLCIDSPPPNSHAHTHVLFLYRNTPSSSPSTSSRTDLLSQIYPKKKTCFVDFIPRGTKYFLFLSTIQLNILCPCCSVSVFLLSSKFLQALYLWRKFFSKLIVTHDLFYSVREQFSPLIFHSTLL
jgi:hypothetical protein